MIPAVHACAHLDVILYFPLSVSLISLLSSYTYPPPPLHPFTLQEWETTDHGRGGHGVPGGADAIKSKLQRLRELFLNALQNNKV